MLPVKIWNSAMKPEKAGNPREANAPTANNVANFGAGGQTAVGIHVVGRGAAVQHAGQEKQCTGDQAVAHHLGDRAADRDAARLSGVGASSPATPTANTM